MKRAAIMQPFSVEWDYNNSAGTGLLSKFV